ncbi:hypothetical protein V6380_13940 [Acinetobacter variabilis]|uniref:hypothetical protein n=1 Tax=Acinetobacter variabilis TaxID=70346 RepID=UPI003B83ACBC
MNHVSICSLKQSTINQINSYLSSIGRKQFTPDYIKAIKNPVMSEEIQNTLELNFRGFFIDISHSDNPDEANMYALVLDSAINGRFTDVLMLHPNFEPSSIKQMLM